MSLSKIAILQDRAVMLSTVRSFFSERNVLEVDVPLCSAFASVDEHIDLVPADSGRFLHSSPEYGMKRLLAHGLGDIYQLSHVFRQGEYGHKHNPEFMMAEWYRLNFSFQQMIEETVAFVELFIGKKACSIKSYREVFQEYAGFDYVLLSNAELLQWIHHLHLPIYSGIEQEGRDALLNIILGVYIEPHLGKGELFVLQHYPSTQAALAQTVVREEEHVAERFEIYYEGIELANGYHELANPDEQRQRLHQANKARLVLGKQELPIDERFLAALQKGLPECCGVAVGFDRLMMLRHGKVALRDVIPFDWADA